MFNFNRNNNTATSTAGTSSAGNSFLSSSSWNTNNNSSSTSTGGFSFANNNNNNQTNSLGFPSTSSFATNNNTTGLGSGAGFTFNSSVMFSTGNNNNNGNSMMGSNNNSMFKFNTATTNNNTLPSSSFASNNNPFTTNSSSSTSTFPAFSSSFNTMPTTSTMNNNSKPSFPSFVPTPFTANSGEKIKYYSLNKMEHYKDKSFEECRYDYWYAQKNGTLPASSSATTTSNNTSNNWMNSGSSLTSNSNSAWSMPSAISTTTGTNPTTTTNNSTPFNFGLNSTNNTAATNNTTGNTLGSVNWLSNNNNNNNNGGSMFNTNNNTTSSISNGMFPSTNGTSNMFNTNPTTAPSTSTFNFNNGTTNNTLPTNNSSTFTFPSSTGNNTAQPSMFNLGVSSNPTNPTTANNSTPFNFGLNSANSTTTANNMNQPFSWNTSANNNNLTSSNPTSNGTSSFLSSSLPSFQPSTIGSMFTNTNPTTTGNTSTFNFTNTANSNGMMTTANIPINSDATLLSVLNQPYGENSLYEEKYQPLAFMTKVESEEESTQDDKSSKELSASFCARPRLGKFKKPTLAEKLTLINNQAQMEEKQQTQENLFDDLAFRHKNSLKELTIFPNNAFNKNEKSIYPTIEENVIETHEERISSNTIIVKTSSHQTHQPRASPPTNVDLVKPKAVKGMIFQSEEFHKKKEERVTVPKFLPKLTKEGYYTIPSMKELSMMSNADLKNCRNFTIGRHGYGEIQVLGYLDLTRGLDLDRIVCEIEKHHVDLYSNHSPNEKPQVGSELNRPCIITLFNVHPTTQSKSTFEKMTQFQAKLKKANQKSGSEFINYSNGEWIFKVNHF